MGAALDDAGAEPWTVDVRDDAFVVCIPESDVIVPDGVAAEVGVTAPAFDGVVPDGEPVVPDGADAPDDVVDGADTTEDCLGVGTVPDGVVVELDDSVVVVPASVCVVPEGAGASTVAGAASHVPSSLR